MGSEARGWRLCVIPEARGGRSLQDVARDALKGGADVLQLRIKGATDRELLGEGRLMEALCREFDRPLVVNDRPDLALILGAKGVHLGQDDLPVAEVRRLLGSRAILGVSVHGAAEARKAERDGADYVAVGPVFPTPVKEGEPALGLETLAEVWESVTLPVLAIGGIDVGNAGEVIGVGADGVAVISAVSGAEDPRAAAVALARAVDEGFARRRRKGA